MRLAYFGPAGTYTESAAIRYAPDAQRTPFSTPTAVARAVASRMVDQGVVPIENSLEGAVPETLDLLIHDAALSICAEVVLPIAHFLLSAPGTSVQQVQTIYSHPQALAQCRGFIERCFPKAQAVAALSTAAAVEKALAEPGTAAIGNVRAAEIYGAQVLAEGIQDTSNNETRFVVLALHDHPATGDDKTSLCFAFEEDRPGSLVRVLDCFSSRNVNLAKIESRPSRESLGRYIFLADLHGHRTDPAVADAIAEAVRLSDRERFRVFGSYPRFR